MTVVCEVDTIEEVIKKNLETINDYIDYYQQDLPEDEYSREIPDKELSSEQLDIVNEIYSELPNKCREFKRGDIGAEQLQEYASNLLYAKYNPDILYEVLSREVYDFLMLLDEFTFFLKKE